MTQGMTRISRIGRPPLHMISRKGLPTCGTKPFVRGHVEFLDDDGARGIPVYAGSGGTGNVTS